MPRIIISEPGKTPQPYRLKTDRIVTKIGRASDNDIIITAGSASTYHCKMKRVEGGFILADNNSTNGIKHDDTQYGIIDLVNGMTVKIGDDIDMEFNLSDEEVAILSQEDFEPQQKASFPKSNKKSQPAAAPSEEDEVILEEAKPKSESKSKTKSKSSKEKSSSEEDEKPKRKAKSDKPVTTTRPVSTKSNSGLSFIIFMILAVLFFVGGLAVRHYQDHKTFIFSK